MSNSLWPHGLQHSRLPCPSPSPRVCSNSCPLSQWCHPIISSSVVPFSSCPQSFPVFEDYGCAEADLCWLENQVEGICPHWGLWQTYCFGCQVFSGGSQGHLWDHHPGQLSIDPVGWGSYGNKISKPHTIPCKVTARCGWCLSSLPQGYWHHLSPCAQEATADGQNWQLLPFCWGLHHHPGQLHQSHFDAISKIYWQFTPDLIIKCSPGLHIRSSLTTL